MHVKWNKCKHLGSKTSARFPPAKGLGDWIDVSLTAVGITDERWAWLVSRFKSDVKKQCAGCDHRHTFANWFGRFVKLPEGQGPELQDALKIVEMPEQRVFYCAVKGRCIGRGTLPDTILKPLDLQTCQTCNRFERET